MRVLNKLFLSIIILLVILALTSFLLPQKQHVERTVEMSAPAEKIFPYLNTPNLFSQWSPWSKLDPQMKVQFMGPESGEGAGMSWQSEQSNVGNGSWIISRAVDNEALDMVMDFGDQGTANSFFRLDPNNAQTKVTWGFDTDAGMNPVMRWFGLMMDSMVGKEYEKGLNTLKNIVETK
jgi:uncharacterized protein YndB with AHSA1/START domain